MAKQTLLHDIHRTLIKDCSQGQKNEPKDIGLGRKRIGTIHKRREDVNWNQLRSLSPHLRSQQSICYHCLYPFSL